MGGPVFGWLWVNTAPVKRSNADWQSLIGDIEVLSDHGGIADWRVDADDELTSFQL